MSILFSLNSTKIKAYYDFFFNQTQNMFEERKFYHSWIQKREEEEEETLEFSQTILTKSNRMVHECLN